MSAILRGKPNEVVDNGRLDNEGGFQQANIKLNATEAIISLRNLQGGPITSHNALTLLSLLGNHHGNHDLRLI